MEYPPPHPHQHPAMDHQYNHGGPPGLQMIPMMDHGYNKRKLDNGLDDGPPKKRQGRRKIKIEFIEDKSRRQITFSKRKAGIMKKAYELTTLTGTQALLLIASETGHVYTFATSKLQPFVTHQEGKALIQRCLNSPENGSPPGEHQPAMPEQGGPIEEQVMYPSHQTGVVESTLVLLVGKLIPVINSFSSNNLSELQAIGARYGVDVMAAGYPSNFSNPDPAQNYPISTSVVAGIRVAEVDYTSENQPAFAIEQLRHFLSDAPTQVPPDFWTQLSNIPFVVAEESLVDKQNSLFVVSTYEKAYVNVVFGVRKIGDKGHQVVGISCMPPDNYVCHLDVDETSHRQRMNMTTEVDGTPMYHLLPEISA